MIASNLINLRHIPANRQDALRNQITSYFSRNAGVNALEVSLCFALRRGRVPLPANEAEWIGHEVGPLRINNGGVHGLGVFATENIAAGTDIIAARGCLVRLNVFQTPEEAAYTWEPPGPYAKYGISQLDPTWANITRFLQAGDENSNNVELEWVCGDKIVIFRSTKFIPAGTELLCHYLQPQPAAAEESEEVVGIDVPYVPEVVVIDDTDDDAN